MAIEKVLHNYSKRFREAKKLPDAEWSDAFDDILVELTNYCNEITEEHDLTNRLNRINNELTEHGDGTVVMSYKGITLVAEASKMTKSPIETVKYLKDHFNAFMIGFAKDIKESQK